MVVLILIIGSWMFIFLSDKANFFGMFTEKNLMFTKKFIGELLGIYIFSREVPELVWAMIIIFILKPGILPGALALEIHNFGILGKLCAEVIEDLDMRPSRSLASCGANSFQVFIYGVIPAVMPKFITYILYRGEVILRSTIIVGFVGTGGLGQQFRLSMSYFRYTEITLILLCYIMLVVLEDLFFNWARKLSEY